LKTLADLRAVKSRILEEMAARDQNAKYRIVVAMGTCGIAAGARNVMTAILDEISRKKIPDVVVTQSGCLGYCDQEPIVQVVQPDQTVIVYGKVTPGVARKIITEHISRGEVLSDHVFMQKPTLE